MKLCWDIETDGLTHTKVWCLAVVDIDTNEESYFTDYDDAFPSIMEGLKLLSKATHHIGHNLINFDIPALTQHYGWIAGPKQKIIDTMLLSQLNDFYRPSLDKAAKEAKKGNHAMKSWGIAFQDFKEEDPDWMEYSPEMQSRCISDVYLNIKMFRYLDKETRTIINEGNGYGNAIRLEHEVSECMARQLKTGWLFDQVGANEMLLYINKRMAEIELLVEPNLEPRTVYMDKEPRHAKRLKNGEWDRVTREWFQDRIVETPYVRFKIIQTDLGNNDAVLKLLFANGWKPTEWHYKKIDGKFIKGSPKLTEDSYESIEGEIGQMVGEWRTLRSRRGLLDGLIKLCSDDSRIVCDAFVIGTNTFRMRHRGIVNIPGPYAVLGKELRKLFTSAEGRKVVACDSDGNQLRGFAHYLDNAEVTEAITHGSNDLGTDIHTRNANIVGVTRPIVKNLTYALLFGAGDSKLGQTAGMRGQGKELRAKMMVAYPGYQQMMDRIDNEWDMNNYKHNRGFVTGLDGRRIYCEGYKAFNALLQAYEAVTCKEACVQAMKMIRAEGLDAQLMCMMHDELNFESSESDASRVAEILEFSFGEHVTNTYNLNIQMGGSSVIGDNWYDVH